MGIESLTSPGILVTETDLSQTVSSRSSTTGAICGSFQMGPCNKPVLVSSEQELVSIFGKPMQSNNITFFTAANFLAYSNRLYVVRAVNSSANNAYANSGPTVSSTANIKIYNPEDYEDNIINADKNIIFAAKGPGKKYNDLAIHICSDKNRFRSVKHLGKTSTGIDRGEYIFANTYASNNFIQFVKKNGQPLDVTAVLDGGGDMVIELDYKSAAGVIPEKRTVLIQDPVGTSNSKFSVYSNTKLQTQNTVPVIVKWKYADYFKIPPGTSEYCRNNNSTDDEMHILIRDKVGTFVNQKNGGVLETFSNVSKAIDAKTETGESNYYVEVLKSDSKYIYALNASSANVSWGNTAANTAFFSDKNATYNLNKGNGGSELFPEEKDVIEGYSLFHDKERIQFDLLLTGDGEGSNTVIAYAANIAETRKDCIAFVSPDKISSILSSSTNKPSDILANILDFRSQEFMPSSSFVVMDCNWKYQFDKYWNTYRYIPLNGDIAGLVARTEVEKDSWWSPAGFSRGKIQNAIKLAWNPDQAKRDQLYENGINPVVSFPNEGVILYGDKTLLNKTSAFNRINVRRLFLTLEKAISNAAKQSLFEFNDEFTRSQFVALIEPYLRDVKAKRGIYDFKVICDTSNNTPLVIDNNRFVASIFIKPARSVNFIELNFVAVGTNIEFSSITDSAGL